MTILDILSKIDVMTMLGDYAIKGPGGNSDWASALSYGIIEQM